MRTLCASAVSKAVLADANCESGVYTDTAAMLCIAVSPRIAVMGPLNRRNDLKAKKQLLRNAKRTY
jgi:hypothetical protein